MKKLGFWKIHVVCMIGCIPPWGSISGWIGATQEVQVFSLCVQVSFLVAMLFNAFVNRKELGF